MHSIFAKRPAGQSGDTASKVSRHNASEPWVEKYRPKKVDDLVFQVEVVSVLQKVIQGADLPNILLYGPPGTGKTSAAVALCRQLFKTTEVYKDRVLEMNASDERGIQIVRTRIKDFAHRAVSASSVGGYAAALKVIILDEADAMTSPAQAALRRTMEKYSKNTRFFLICNYISRIIDPLTSRCAKFRFKPLPVDCQVERLQLICKEEGVDADEEALHQLVDQSEGDLRKSITKLQAIGSASKRIRAEDVADMGGRIPDQEVDKYLEAIKSLSDTKVNTAIEELRRSGHCVAQLFAQLHEKLLSNEELADIQKANVFHNLAVADYRLQDGGDEQLQLLNFSYSLLDQCRISAAN